ncbi:MAG: hypothetical protein ACRDI2_09440, partial [Chloroflexota bacterium]
MSRSRGLVGVTLAVGATLLLAVAMLVWPRVAAERLKAIEEARTFAVASVPAPAVDRARVETQPTAYGWRVVFRDAQVPCAQTSWGCRVSPSQTDEALVYRDLFVCVEYGTARG